MRQAIILAMSIPIVLTETLVADKARLLAQPRAVKPDGVAGPRKIGLPQSAPRSQFERGRGFR